MLVKKELLDKLADKKETYNECINILSRAIHRAYVKEELTYFERDIKVEAGKRIMNELHSIYADICYIKANARMKLLGVEAKDLISETYKYHPVKYDSLITLIRTLIKDIKDITKQLSEEFDKK